jgi:hypothetical protein
VQVDGARVIIARGDIEPATLYARPATDGARRIGGLGMARHTSAHAEAQSANQPLQPSRKSRELLGWRCYAADQIMDFWINPGPSRTP